MERVIELLKLVDFDKSEIRRDNRAVFLCGGQLNVAAPVCPSVREALLRHLPTRDKIDGAKIILAERAKEALPGSKFTNLLDFEEYISAAVDGVILIVESAGSICELGAFVKTPEINFKLIIVISSVHYNTPSFVKLGALDYFEQSDTGNNETSPFHWDLVEDGVVVHDYVLLDMVSEIKDSIQRVRAKGKFAASDLGDRIYLTLSICYLLRGAKLAEIKECYREIGLGKFEREIVRHLSVLEILDYLMPVSHGKKITFFVPMIARLPLKIAFGSDVPNRDRDTLRWVRDISGLIAKHEPTRMKIFQEHQNAA